MAHVHIAYTKVRRIASAKSEHSAVSELADEFKKQHQELVDHHLFDLHDGRGILITVWIAADHLTAQGRAETAHKSLFRDLEGFVKETGEDVAKKLASEWLAESIPDLAITVGELALI